MRLKSLLSAFAVATMISSAANAAVVFDNITPSQTAVPGATSTSTASTPNTFLGSAYTLAAGTTSLTGFDLFPVNLSGTNFTGLRATVYIWDNVNTGTVAVGTPAFSGLLGTYVVNLTGTYNNGFIYSIQSTPAGVTPGVSLTTPLALADTTIGMTVNYQGTTDGTTFTSVNSLTSPITAGVPAVVGSNVFNGYYRNANSETDGNFTSTLRSLGLTNQSVGARLFGDITVPEPTSLGLLGLGGLAMLRRKRA